MITTTQFTARDLAQLCLELRVDIRGCLGRLPAVAFEARPDRPQGESGWTAGQIISQDVAVEVLRRATEYLKLVWPQLQACDAGQTSARSHHGMMNLTAWLLLVCVHDNDRPDQLRSREMS